MNTQNAASLSRRRVRPRARKKLWLVIKNIFGFHKEALFYSEKLTVVSYHIERVSSK